MVNSSQSNTASSSSIQNSTSSLSNSSSSQVEVELVSKQEENNKNNSVIIGGFNGRLGEEEDGDEDIDDRSSNRMLPSSTPRSNRQNENFTSSQVHEGVVINNSSHASNFVPGSSGTGSDGENHIQNRKLGMYLIALLAFLAIIAVIIGFVEKNRFIEEDDPSDNGSDSSVFTSSSDITKIAFGSCTAYDERPQPIWTEGVIPSAPHAWFWAGDMAYLDDPDVDCFQYPNAEQCSCPNNETMSWIEIPPHSCNSGKIDHAVTRWQSQLNLDTYQQFTEFMCPGTFVDGYYPPPGEDRSVCPRPILGMYDDHDWGWNDGNRRLPEKNAFKTMFFDAIGVASDSPRRNADRGGYWKYTLNENTNTKDGKKEIDVFFLDERFDRMPLPCQVRRDWCEIDILNYTDPYPNKYGWCDDFLNGGDIGEGSCCKTDERIYWGWCLNEDNKENPLYQSSCNTSSPEYGTIPVKFRFNENFPDNATQGELEEHPRYDFDQSPMCEVLGVTQRKWFQEALWTSKAPVKLIVSPSVILGDPAPQTCVRPRGVEKTNATKVDCYCSGDDWDCYQPAQRNLLYTLQQAEGCVITLTGDFHWSDLKVLKPGSPVFDTEGNVDQNYAHITEYYNSGEFTYPMYQIMASGLTPSTAVNLAWAPFTKDPYGLRIPTDPTFVTGETSFGIVDIRYDENNELEEISLQIRQGTDGTNTLIEHIINPNECRPIS